jgi:inorganic pyrophosphatase
MTLALPSLMTWSLADLPAIDKQSGAVNAIVECSRGHRSKLKHDADHNLFALDRLLPDGTAFPYDFGFIPSTLGEDGDPVDVLIVAEESQHAGCVVPVRIVGVIEATQVEADGREVENDRLIGVATASVLFHNVRELADLAAGEVEQLESFFVNAVRGTGKVFHPHARHGAARARALIDAGVKRRRDRCRGRGGGETTGK